MQKGKTTAFVCQHGTRRQNCSICQPQHSQKELMSTLSESVEAARPRCCGRRGSTALDQMKPKMWCRISLNQQRCPTCHSPVQSPIIDRWALVPPSSFYDTLPLGIYAHVDCSSCGVSFCDACYPAQQNPAIRDFLLRPLVLYELATLTSYEGSDAVCFRLRDLASSAILTVMVHPQTLHVLAAIWK